MTKEEGTRGLSLGFQPKVAINKRPAPKWAVEPVPGACSVGQTKPSIRKIFRPFSNPNPRRGCNSAKAFMNDCLVRAGPFFGPTSRAERFRPRLSPDVPSGQTNLCPNVHAHGHSQQRRPAQSRPPLAPTHLLYPPWIIARSAACWLILSA
jgi:hypothetical protein